MPSEGTVHRSKLVRMQRGGPATTSSCYSGPRKPRPYSQSSGVSSGLAPWAQLRGPEKVAQCGEETTLRAHSKASRLGMPKLDLAGEGPQMC